MDQRSAPRIPPPAIALGGFAMQRLLVPVPNSTLAAKVLAALLAASGTALAIGAERRFRTAGTTANPLRPQNSTALVVSGVFCCTRNPMYLGIVAFSAACALWRGHPIALLPTAGVALWLDRLQIPAEETSLKEKFGPEYARYQRSVPRWITLKCRGKPGLAET